MKREQIKWKEESNALYSKDAPFQCFPQSIRVLRERPPPTPLLPRWAPSTKSSNLDKTSGKAKTNGKWNDEDLVKVIDCYNIGYKINTCVKAFNISRSFLRDCLSGRTTTRKIE